MGAFRDRYILCLLVFLVIFLFFLHYKGNFEIGYDEARHALQGIVFYDYFRNALHGSLSFSDFLPAYTQKYVTIGYQAIHDPPARAVVQAIVYSFMGVNVFAARFATQIFVLLGSFLLYFLALKVLNDKFLALTAAVLFALMPHNYYFSRTSLVGVPTAFAAVGWFYFLFHAKQRHLALRISEAIKLRVNVSLLISTIFLLLLFMNYQGIIYVTIFYVLYIAYLLFINRSKAVMTNYQGIFTYIKDSGAWDIIKKALFQAIIFAIVFGPWLNFVLFRQGHLERLRIEAFQWPAFSHHIDWGFTPSGIWRSGKFAEIVFAPIAVLFQFRFFSLFALIPLVSYIISKNRQDSFIGRNMAAFIFIISVYLFSTFGMSQHQLRYASHMLPFIAIFMVQGIAQFSDYIRQRIGYSRASLLLFVVIAAVFAYSDVGIANSQMNEFGIEDNQVVQYFRNEPLPRIVINLRPRGEYTKSYYYSPDMFIFKMISVHDEYKPDRIQQILQYVDWENVLEPDKKYLQFLESANNAPRNVNVYIVMFNFSSYDNMVVPVSTVLDSYNWTRAELENYVVYRR